MMVMIRLLLVTTLTLVAGPVQGFVAPSSSSTQQVTRTSQPAFWGSSIPETENAVAAGFADTASHDKPKDRATNFDKGVAGMRDIASLKAAATATMALMALLLVLPQPTLAVSGGGLDYANIDITGQNFSSGNYKGKDFTQVIAKGTNFAKSNLQGCRFYKAYLVNADFTGADIRGASLEDTSMDGASLKDTVAIGSYFGNSILDVASLENADFTDAQFPVKAVPLLCDREDLKGTNPVTGADTRESAMCP